MAHESVKSLLSFEQFILDSHHCLCAPDVDILFDSSSVFMLVFLSVCGFTLAQTKQLVWLVWKMLTGPQKIHHFMSRRWFTFEGKVRIEVSLWLQSRSRRDVKKKWDSHGSQYVPATHTETQMHTHTHTQTNHYCVCLGISELTVLPSLQSRSRLGWKCIARYCIRAAAMYLACNLVIFFMCRT